MKPFYIFIPAISHSTI